jgi:hypothetical protein
MIKSSLLLQFNIFLLKVKDKKSGGGKFRKGRGQWKYSRVLKDAEMLCWF